MIMKFNKKNAYLAITLLMVMLISSMISMFPSFADDKNAETATSQTDGNGATISYAELSEVKAEVDQNNGEIYFDQYTEKKNHEFVLYFRVKEEAVKNAFSDYSSFNKNCVIQALYREKKDGLGDEEGWNAVKGQVIKTEQKTVSGEKYIYMTVDLYDGGMRSLKEGADYQLIFQFYELVDGKEVVRCSTNVAEVNFNSVMYKAWKNFFAARAGVTLNEGKINDKMWQGLMDLFKIPMGLIMKLFYSITSNYMLSIFLFALVIKICLFPFGIKQQKNMVKQAKFSPKQVAIQRKYKGRTDQKTMQKMQEEIREAQMAENISLTGGGCLPMILQMIILIALYGVIRNPLTYMSGVSIDAVNIMKQYFMDFKSVGSIDEIKIIEYISANFDQVSGFLSENFGYNLADYVSTESLPNFLLFPGFNISDTPNFQEFNLLLIIPVLVFVSYYFSMKITRKLSYQPPRMEGTPDMMASMKIMDVTMPALSTVICFGVPAMLGIYWVFQSVIGVAQSYILKKMYPYPEYTEEDYKKAEEELKAKHQKKKSKDIDESYSDEKKAKSLHYSDENEEYAVLPEKTSVYDLPKEKRDEIRGNEEKTSAKTGKNNKKSKSGGLIGKAEMDEKDDKSE